MPSIYPSLALLALSASASLASPLLVERQRGESPCFGQPGDRCPPGPYCDATLAPQDLNACQDLINNIRSRPGDLCVNGRACRTWTAPDACRVGICNNDSNGVCEAATQFADWASDLIVTCDRASGGGTFIPDRPQWFEVYVTAPLDQQTPGIARIEASPMDGEEIPVEQFQAENEQIRAASSSREVQKRQTPDDRDFTVTGTFFTVPKDGSSTQVSDILDDGSMWSAEEAETLSFGVSASVGLESSFFEFMTVSAGITVDIGQEFTNSKTTTLTIDCPGACGTVQYIHLYDCYEGNFNPSGAFGEFCVPIDQGRYTQRCFGC